MAWHRGSSSERGYGWDWQKARELAIRRDLGLCVPCLKQGRTTAFAQVDHVIPKAQGGTDDPENLQCICADCHAFKTQGESRGKNIAPVGIDGWPIS